MKRNEALAELRALAEKYEIHTVFTVRERRYLDTDKVPVFAVKAFGIDARGLSPNYGGTPVIWLTRLIAAVGGFKTDADGNILVNDPYDVAASFGHNVSGDYRKAHHFPL